MSTFLLTAKPAVWTIQEDQASAVRRIDRPALDQAATAQRHGTQTEPSQYLTGREDPNWSTYCPGGA